MTPTIPAIRYLRTEDGVDIAYWRLGRGPVLIHTPNVQLGHARSEWSVPAMRVWYERLARRFTVVRYDHRGGGLSSRGQAQSLDALVRDIDAVADRVSPEPFVLLGWLSGGLPAIVYAAMRPSRVSHLVLWSSFARNADHGLAPRLAALFGMVDIDWTLFTESISQAALGWRDADAARRWAEVLRDGTTQREFLAFLEARRGWDVTERLAAVTVPTLVLHDTSNALASEARSRELASTIPRARLALSAASGGAPGDDAWHALLHFIGAEAGRESDTVPAFEELTAREGEVLVELATGATNAEIAERLFISVNTVTRHLTHIYAKIGVRGRAEAVRHVLEHGFTGS